MGGLTGCSTAFPGDHVGGDGAQVLRWSGFMDEVASAATRARNLATLKDAAAVYSCRLPPPWFASPPPRFGGRHHLAGEQHRPSATRATRTGELGGAPRVCTRAPASMLAAPPWLRLSRRGAATSLVAGAGRAGRESEK
jgi:hypothetical protein